MLVPNWEKVIAADRLKAGLGQLADDKPFRSTPEPDPTKLWDALKAYAASSSSWIWSVTDAGGAEVLLLQNEVVNPMRYLLQEKARRNGE